MSLTTPAVDTNVPSLHEQSGRVLGQLAGYVGVRALATGLRSGLIEALAGHPDGASAQSLADELGLDPFYVAVWLRAAYGAELVELVVAAEHEGWDPQARRFTDLDEQTYLLAPHMEELLLDEGSPAYIGGMPQVLLEPEMFDAFEENLASGERLWWDDCSPRFLQGVSRTGGPFYTRLLPGGLERVPGLAEVLTAAPRVLELCCGVGRGLVRVADHVPGARLTGVDGDAHSLELARRRLEESGVDEVELHCSSLEDLDVGTGYDLVFINISMHECRDIARVTDNVYRALRPGGHFVISDFPFPAATRDCRSVPARIMSGIQCFEALIDDQLMPTEAFRRVLHERGFEGVGSFDISPVHAVTHGRRPRFSVRPSPPPAA